MPKLKVCPLAKDDVYKDIVRIPETYRTDGKGRAIEESTVCWIVCGIEGVAVRCVAVLRGFITDSSQEIHMDERTRNRLGVNVNESYDFKFAAAGLCGQRPSLPAQ